MVNFVKKDGEPNLEILNVRFLMNFFADFNPTSQDILEK
jgi:hypothetical protein